jgi:hypothetical protein
MKRRIMLLAGMLAGSWFSAQGQVATATPTAAPSPVTMPEPSNIAELGVTLSALLGYCWWRVSRRKRQDS